MEYQSIIEWDSFAHVSLMLALESEFNIIIDHSLVIKLITFEKINNYITQLNKKEISTQNTRELSGLHSIFISNEDILKPEKNLDHLPKICRGLNEVYFDKTKITYIDSQGKFEYRGYSIDTLLENSNFEESIYLLLYNKIPDSSQLLGFKVKLQNLRCVPDELLLLLKTVSFAQPLEQMRIALSALAAFDSEFCDPEKDEHNGLRLIACLPTILNLIHANRLSQIYTFDNRYLSTCKNFLFNFYGRDPSPTESLVFEKDFILHADHESNASTFAARIAASTKAPILSSIISALSVFSGPLHGGAIQDVIKLILEINSPENVVNHLTKLRNQNVPIAGFGHRVYRTEDPRAKHYKIIAYTLAKEKGATHLFDIIEEMTKYMKPYAEHGIGPNVDLYGGLIYHNIGIPQDMYVCVFALSRIVGWVAHVLEQKSNNILIRPRLFYDGNRNLTYS